jgi:hypothetical protein
LTNRPNTALLIIDVQVGVVAARSAERTAGVTPRQDISFRA